MREEWPAVQPDAGDAADGKMHDQHVARLVARIVHRRAVHGRHLAVGKQRSIKACCLLGLAVVPDANRVVCDTCQVATPSRLEIEPSSRGAKASVVGGLTNEFRGLPT